MTTADPESRIVSTFPSDTEVVMERTFRASRELVFRAFVDPELIPHWWGSRSATTVVDTLDARPGGKWRFVAYAPDGTEYAFRGEFREVTPPESFVWTFEFEGMPGHIIVATLTFTESDGKTTVTETAVFASKEDRDGMIATGMEEGGNESYDRLAELLATLTAE
jgi:uncharacterized protein YndB with AHSA1/START domain